jgi:hypothetical protein
MIKVFFKRSDNYNITKLNIFSKERKYNGNKKESKKESSKKEEKITF